ncbi:MAG: FixH family protein [Bosea sp. (in: a-proteobacteria)]
MPHDILPREILPHDATHRLVPQSSVKTGSGPRPSSTVAKPPRPVTGRFVLFCCIAFFGTIAAVNAVMMTLAIRTMPGLDVANGYVASQSMNREIETMRSQTERAWTADIAAGLKDGVTPVSVSLTDKAGQPVTGLSVTVRLAHPALTRADHTSMLIERRPGLYAADFSDVQAGAWTLVVEANQRGERVFASRNRIILAEPRP